MPVALVILVMGVFALLTSIAGANRAQNTLDTWAQENGFTIVYRERRLLFKGPYSLFCGRHQDVFYVKVETMDGQVRSGYVRTSRGFMGLTPDRAEVSWE